MKNDNHRAYNLIEGYERIKNVEINCLIEPGLLFRGGLMIVTGQPGTGKSFMVQQIAHEIASGRRILGILPGKQGKVLYIELERQSDLSRKRFFSLAWRNWYGVAAENLLYFDSVPLKIDTRDGYKLLEKLIADNIPDVVIIDSFATIIDNESEQGPIKDVVDTLKGLAKRWETSFILVQHMVKKGTVYNQKKAEFFEAPLRLDDIKGNKYLLHMVDTVCGVVSEKGRKEERVLLFMKHNWSEVDLVNSDPITFEYKPNTTVPYQTQSRASEILAILDRSGGMGTNDLCDAMKITHRPNIQRYLAYLEKYGLIGRVEGHGRGNETFYTPSKWVF